MRMIISIVGFILFIVGCQNLVPTSYKYGTLPTHEYGQRDRSAVFTVDALDNQTTRAIRARCHDVGYFTVVHDGVRERYTCALEGK